MLEESWTDGIVCEMICEGVLGATQNDFFYRGQPELTSEDWEAISLAVVEDVQAIFHPCLWEERCQRKINVRDTLVPKRISLFPKFGKCS